MVSRVRHPTTAIAYWKATIHALLVRDMLMPNYMLLQNFNCGNGVQCD